MARKAKQKRTKTPAPITVPITKMVTKTIRLEITVEAPEDMPRESWQSLESLITNRALQVATHRPADKAITFQDAFETVGLTVKDVSNVIVGDESPDYSDVARMAERWYHDEVKSCADDVIGDLKGLPPHDREESLHDMVHEAVDGRQCIIYTAQARMVLAATDNPDAYEDVNGNGAIGTWEQAAYFAMHQDVDEAINRRLEEWHPDHMPDADDSDDE